MIILEDTRNKPTKNVAIRWQLEELGFPVERTKLYVGDYTFPTNQSICIDTKQDLQEVVGNVTQQHERFKAECVRAQESGIQLIILIAEKNIHTIDDVYTWFNPRKIYSKKATSGRQLAKIMLSMESKYGVKFRFCHPEHIGRTIVALLQGELK